MTNAKDNVNDSVTSSVPFANLPTYSKYDSLISSTLPQNTLQFYDSSLSFIANDSLYTTSVFENHLLKPKSFTKNSINNNNEDWILIPFLAIIILYLYVSTNFHQRWIQTLKAPFSKRYLGQLERDGNIFNETILFPLFFIEILSISLLFYFGIEHFSGTIEYSKPLIYFYSLMAYPLFFLTKMFLLRIIAYVFSTEAQTNEFLLQSFLTISITSLFTYPLILIFAYSQIPFFLYASALIIVLFTLFKNVKAFIIWNNTYNYFKIFIYLCTVEFLPYLIIVKTVLKIINQ